MTIDPLNTEHIKRVNEAEAKYWKSVCGVPRVDGKLMQLLSCTVGACFVFVSILHNHDDD